MLQMIFRLACWLTTLALLPVLVIRTQGYDNSVLRPVLIPSGGCSMPCLMGIVPGGTRSDEALDLLNAHTWVDSVERGATVRWTWSGHQPAMIAPDSRGEFSILAAFDRPLVASIYVMTELRYGDLLLALGNPSRGYLAVDQQQQGIYMYYRFVYDAWKFQARLLPIKLECPFHPLVLYHMPVRIEMGMVSEQRSPDHHISFDPSRGNHLVRSLHRVGRC